ncbi:CrcB protein [Reichenbachiella agariperforans]|uniref:Fluoride-specific ion channel FluC n=1 Tax=Reichenbachiella agariperforans TaxID=156994 RepID=A0A1M6U9J5_REIAG|nr:fluoride efflux transporter CrcB [Reichenbachiella agariperforans]SHK65841.1 CrcB protein [Reichenbachiella agariperforans]
MIKLALFVGIGGFLGSIGRFLLAQVFVKWFPGFSSVGTLAVNLIGCFILGVLVHSATKLDKEYFLLLTTGFCGGFTTFSTFGIENLNYLINNNINTALLYMAISLVFGLLAAFAGWYIGRLLIA